MSNLGRPAADRIGDAWALRFNLQVGRRENLMRWLTPELCWQLCRCRNDEARRLLLGVSR